MDDFQKDENLLEIFFGEEFSETNFFKGSADAELAKKFLRFDSNHFCKFPNFIILEIIGLFFRHWGERFRVKGEIEESH